MATNSKKKSNALIGSQTQPVVLDATKNLSVDTKKLLIDNIIQTGISGGLNASQLAKFTSISNARDQIYQLIDTMCQDSTVSAIVRTYAEDVCEPGDSGHIVWCEATDANVGKYVNYLLNIMNVDKYIYSWVYHLIKYGDLYLRLYRESDYSDLIFNKDNIKKAVRAKQSLTQDIDANALTKKQELNESVNINIHTANDRYSHYVQMVEDPGTMFELTKYGKTFGFVQVPNTQGTLNYMDNFMISNNTQANTYHMKTGDVNIFQADDFVHACLDENTGRFPEKVQIFTQTSLTADKATSGHYYTVRRGKSLLADSYKIWREKALLENAALLNRITKSSIVRTIQVEVGDMSKEQVQQTLRRIKDLMQQKSAVNTGSSMNEYPNGGPIENNIYLATHNGQGAVSIGAVGGDVEVKNLADLDWWNNKFYSSYGIPKQYFGWTDDGAGFNGGTSLTILSSVYAKGVKRVQNAILQAITDCINLFFLEAGMLANLNNFVLKMRAPITQEEIDYRSALTNKISAISSFQALLTDIEDKTRRLQILKVLVSGLEYGDEILEQIQKEIDAVAKAAQEEAAAQAEGDAGAEAPAGGQDELPPVEDSMTESYIPQGKLVLTQDETDLPTPEELDKNKDFTKNN